MDPKHLYPNDGGKPGDILILTKKLGVGIVCTANRVGEASKKAMDEATASMTTLNKAASEISRKYEVHACTDVTGFGFLGHLHEMMGEKLSCQIWADQIPYIEDAFQYADEFLLTAAGQRNRNYVSPYVSFDEIPFAMEEILFDPQTSGGLLLAVGETDAAAFLKELRGCGLPAEVVGAIREKSSTEIQVINTKL